MPIDVAKYVECLDSLPTRCQRRCCESMGMFVKPIADKNEMKGQEAMLPLKAVEISAKIESCFAVVDFSLKYENPSEDTALELIFELPLEKTTLISKLGAELNGRVI